MRCEHTKAAPTGAAPDMRAEASALRVTYAPDLRRYYPAALERRGVEGTVRVGLLVDPRGCVTRAWIEDSSGADQLDRAALALIHAYRFESRRGVRRTHKQLSFRRAASTAT